MQLLSARFLSFVSSGRSAPTVAFAPGRNLESTCHPCFHRPVNFSVLGALAVTDDEMSLPLGGPKQRAVLAILLLNANEPVSRDRLVDGVWGDQPPANPAQALDTYVSRLRKVLGPERIDRGGGGYVLRVHRGELDVDRFEELAAAGKFNEALAVWRGPALSDLLFEPFAQRAADELEERRIAVTEESIDAALAAGAAGAVVPRLEQLVREHPWRERLLGQLMVALYQDGRQERALDVYRQAKQNLARELGLEPSPRLAELERQILAHDPALGRPPKPAPSRQRTRLFRYVVAAASAAAIATVIAIVLRSTRSDAVTVPPASATRLVAFDASSRRIEVASTPADAPTALASGFGSLWVADPNGGQILRINRRNGSVTDRIAVPGQPSSLAVGASAVWVASAVGGFVTRIDPATDRPTRVRRLGGANSSALLFVDHALWVADQADHSLVEMDPRTGSILHTITLDLAPTGLTAGRGQIWAAGYTAGAVDQVDLVSHQVVARLPVGQGPSAIVAGGGSIWVANGLDGTLTRIDSTTGQVVSQAPVVSGPSALAVTGNSVWVASEYSGEVVQVDARTGVKRSVVRCGGRPITLAADGTRVWVGGAPATSLHRGGTLTLSGTTPPNSLDPAFELSGSWEPTQLTRLVHDTLVTFANAPGATGLRLVPDLAVALPQPTDRGRTYVFRIRPGIRYSTGRVVRASDFRRAFLRLFRAHSPGTGFYTSIVGAGACQAGRAPCALSGGRRRR